MHSTQIDRSHSNQPCRDVKPHGWSDEAKMVEHEVDDDAESAGDQADRFVTNAFGEWTRQQSRSSDSIELNDRILLQCQG